MHVTILYCTTVAYTVRANSVSLTLNLWQFKTPYVIQVFLHISVSRYDWNNQSYLALIIS